MTNTPVPVTCSLTSSAAARQLDEWSELVARCDRVVVVGHGVRIAIPAPLVGAARDLIARESQCCAFLSFAASEQADGGLEVTITSVDPAGRPVVHLLTGVDSA